MNAMFNSISQVCTALSCVILLALALAYPTARAWKEQQHKREADKRLKRGN